MLEKLKTKKNIRNFFLIIGLFLVSLILIRIALTISWLPRIDSKLTHLTEYFFEFTDKLIISLIVTVLVASFIYLLTKDDKEGEVWIVEPEDIGGALKKARKNADKWYFSGGSGSYTRTQTIPYLASLAADKNKTIPINLQLINPLNEMLCEEYANYRNSLKSVKHFSEKSKKSVQLDILSTIISCYAWKTEQPRLSFKIGCRDSFSIMRTDLSSENVILTKENPSDSALAYKKDSIFYIAQEEDLINSFKSIKVLDPNLKFVKKENITEEKIKELLTKLKLDSVLKTDADYESLLGLINNMKNPYGK